GDSVKFRERDRLNHIEVLRRAKIEILDSLLSIEPMEELPRGVGQIEERPAIFRDQETVVVAHSYPRQGILRGGGRAARHDGKQDGDCVQSNAQHARLLTPRKRPREWRGSPGTDRPSETPLAKPDRYSAACPIRWPSARHRRMEPSPLRRRWPWQSSRA